MKSIYVCQLIQFFRETSPKTQCQESLSRVGWAVRMCGPWALEATHGVVAPATRSILPSALQTFRESQTCWARPGPQAGHVLLDSSTLPPMNPPLHVVVATLQSALWGLLRHWAVSATGTAVFDPGATVSDFFLWQDISQCHRNRDVFPTLFMYLGEPDIHTHKHKQIECSNVCKRIHMIRLDIPWEWWVEH